MLELQPSPQEKLTTLDKRHTIGLLHKTYEHSQGDLSLQEMLMAAIHREQPNLRVSQITPEELLESFKRRFVVEGNPASINPQIEEFNFSGDTFMNTQGHIIAAEEKVMFDMDYHLKVMQGLFEGEPRSVLLSMFDEPFEMTESPYEELLANIGRRIFSRDEKFQTYPGRERVGTGKDRYMSYIVDYIILKNSTGTPAIDAIYQKVSVFYQQELTSNPEFKTQFETFISYYNEHHSDLEPLKMELIFSDTNNLSAAENEVG